MTRILISAHEIWNTAEKRNPEGKRQTSMGRGSSFQSFINVTISLICYSPHSITSLPPSRHPIPTLIHFPSSSTALPLWTPSLPKPHQLPIQNKHNTGDLVNGVLDHRVSLLFLLATRNIRSSNLEGCTSITSQEQKRFST